MTTKKETFGGPVADLSEATAQTINEIRRAFRRVATGSPTNQSDLNRLGLEMSPTRAFVKRGKNEEKYYTRWDAQDGAGRTRPITRGNQKSNAGGD